MGRPYGCLRGTVLAPAGAMNSGVRLTPETILDIRQPDRVVSGRRRMLRFNVQPSRH